MLFVGEPKMKVGFTGSSLYTNYLTENFDSIAYHDKLTFLEMVKLMLTIEWLRDKGVSHLQRRVDQRAYQQAKL